MLARAAVAMPTCADFVVKAAVYFVLFGAEDGGEIAGKGRYVSEGFLEYEGPILTWPCCEICRGV